MEQAGIVFDAKAEPGKLPVVEKQVFPACLLVHFYRGHRRSAPALGYSDIERDLPRGAPPVPAAEFKGQRDHVLILNDAAWSIIETCRGQHSEFVFVYTAPGHKPGRIGTINNTGWQNSRATVGLERVRVHDLRHTYGQRLRDAGVSEEDRALLLGHAIEGMPQHYATATVARLADAANKVAFIVDRTTLLRVVNG